MLEKKNPQPISVLFLKFRNIVNQHTFKRVERQPWDKNNQSAYRLFKELQIIKRKMDKRLENTLYKRAYPNDDNGNDNEEKLGLGVGEGGGEEKRRKEVINSLVARECKLNEIHYSLTKVAKLKQTHKQVLMRTWSKGKQHCVLVRE